MSKKKLAGIIVASTIAIFVILAIAIPSEPASTPTAEPEIIQISAVDLYSQYEANQVRADELYEDKTLRVTGIIISIGEELMGRPYIVLGEGQAYEVWGVQCVFDDKEDVIPLDKGQVVTVEGKCQGYLINVIMEHCSLVS